MSARQESHAAGTTSGDARDQVARLVDEVLQLSIADVDPPDFFREFLSRVLAALAAPCGVVWVRGADDSFREAAKLDPPGLLRDAGQVSCLRRDGVLRSLISRARPVLWTHQPEDRPAEPAEPAAAGLPAGWAALLTPVLLNGQVIAAVEVWLGPDRDARAAPGFIQFMARMADLAAVYHLRRQRPADDNALWERLDAFACRVHRALNPTEVAFQIVNEGLPLVGCDRLAVALRRGRRAVIEAVSGAELVDHRAGLVRKMSRLCDRVLDWGEQLVYRGVPDESLPPLVLRELDAYLEESHGKFLIVSPLKDERDPENTRPARAVLLMESFALSVPPEQLEARLDTLSRHAATAIYNAADHRGIPLRYLWQPVAAVQRGLGGTTRAIVAAVILTLVAVISALVFVPYPLKLDARGQLLPVQRRWVYAPVDGQVVRFAEGLEPGSLIAENQALVLLYDVQLESKLVQLTQEVAAAQQDVEALSRQFNAATTEGERLRFSSDKKQREAARDRKFHELRLLRERTNSDASRPGYFWLRSPLAGTVLSWDFRETLTNKQVKPSEPLLRVGDKEKSWEVELKIPEKQMGQVVKAFAAAPPGAELDVDILVTSAPTRTFKGKLAANQVSGEAAPGREDTPGEPSESTVTASVRLDGPDIAPDDRVPPELLLSGTEVHAKVRCGDHALGYSLFYGVGEFFCERVLFFF